MRRSVIKTGGEFVFSDPKTYAGQRTIYLPQSTVELLRERKRSSLTEWIFHNPHRPEEPINPSCAYYRMKVILEHAGLPSIRFHDLRHTFTSNLLSNGQCQRMYRSFWDRPMSVPP